MPKKLKAKKASEDDRSADAARVRLAGFRARRRERGPPEVEDLIARFDGLIEGSKDDGDLRSCLVEILPWAADFFGDCAQSVEEDALLLAYIALGGRMGEVLDEPRASSILEHMAVLALSVLSEAKRHHVELTPTIRAGLEKVESFVPWDTYTKVEVTAGQDAGGSRR